MVRDKDQGRHTKKIKQQIDTIYQESPTQNVKEELPELKKWWT